MKLSKEERVWRFFYKRIKNSYGTAGLIGNLFAESGLEPKNLQNTGNKKLGMTDGGYTAAVDQDVYKNFVRDSQGYGLAQWTYWTRKQALLDYAKKKGKSIGNLRMQMEFLWNELNVNYIGVLRGLECADSVRAASDIVLTKFERPANQSVEVQKKRASYGQEFYNKYAKIYEKKYSGKM